MVYHGKTASMNPTEIPKQEADSRREDQVHRTIVIGSSPAVLLQALFLFEQGRHLTILESKDQLGGAWYGRNLWGLGHIDVGCHYIDRRASTFRFLTEELNLACDRQRYDYLWYTGSPSRKEEQSTPSMMARVQRELMNWLIGNRLVQHDLYWLIHSIAMLNLRYLPTAFSEFFLKESRLYPRGGAHAIVSAILAKIEKSSIEVIKGVTVDRVVVGEDGTEVTVDTDKNCYRAIEVVTGQNVSFRVLQNEKSLLQDRPRYSATHTVLRIKGQKQRPFDYIDIFKSAESSLRRIQDVTPYAIKRSNLTRKRSKKVIEWCRGSGDLIKAKHDRQQPNRQKDDLLICCQHSGEFCSEEETASELLKHLKQIRLLANHSQLVAWHCESYITCSDPSRDSSPEMKDKLPQQIQMLPTNDLSKSLELTQSRWSSLS